RPVARGFLDDDTADRRHTRAGRRTHARFRRLRRRLSASAVPHGPRRPAARRRPRADRDPRPGGRAGTASGIRTPPPRPRAVRPAHAQHARRAGSRLGAPSGDPGPRRSRAGRGGCPMTRRIVVVSGGLSEPSTTRLLADRIAEATRVAVGARGDDAEIEVIELRSLATDLATTFTAGVPTA